MPIGLSLSENECWWDDDEDKNERGGGALSRETRGVLIDRTTGGSEIKTVYF